MLRSTKPRCCASHVDRPAHAHLSVLEHLAQLLEQALLGVVEVHKVVLLANQAARGVLKRNAAE